jgi:hypothetical protein
MSKDHRFNKKDYGYEDEGSGSEYASTKQANGIKQFLKQKQKPSFKRVDKRSLA